MYLVTLYKQLFRCIQLLKAQYAIKADFSNEMRAIESHFLKAQWSLTQIPKSGIKVHDNKLTILIRM